MSHYAITMKRLLVATILVGSLAAVVRAQEACDAPEPVCAARGAVFRISSFDPVSSAVRLSETLLVTTRHSVADRADVELTRKDGTTVPGKVLPTAYDGDLVLIEVSSLAPGPTLAPAHSPSTDTMLYTVGIDDRLKAPRVYPPGQALFAADPDVPHGRLHHTAYSQFGNSGGALVDASGRLVGIIASGGEGRFEAVPVSELETLKQQSGPQYAERNAKTGTAVRICIENLEQPAPRQLEDDRAMQIFENCSASSNRQLYDLASRYLATRRRLDLARKLSELSVARDPYAINARLILMTVLHFARAFEDEIPHIEFVLDHAPQEPTAQRFAIQAGKWTGNMDLAERGLELVKEHNPAQARAAEAFLKSNVPRPKPLD